MNTSQKLLFAFLMFFAAFASSCFAQVSTFGSDEAEWGWSGRDKGKYSKEAVVSILQKSWGKVDKLDLQEMVDKETFAEFLWKVDKNLVTKAMSTKSSFFVVGAAIDTLKISFDNNGKGEIICFGKGKIMGRVRCQTSEREGEHRQIGAGDYTISDKESLHVSREIKGARMPKALLVSKDRGIYIHCGDLSFASRGCIRVSEPAGVQLFRLVSVGTKVTIVQN